MPTVEALLAQLAAQLEPLYEKPEAHTMAEWVLEHALGVGRFELLQRRREEASEELEAQVHQYLEQLLRQEPLQYVLGEASFYGREFGVTPAVLIPRPETEELVQRVIRTYQDQPQVRLLDIGTGSGCIPITLVAELPGAQVWGLDVSLEALAIAKENAQKLGQPVAWLHQDILREVPAVASQSLDAVISNPPYVLEEEKDLMRQNVLAFEPHLALFVPNEDPLLFYRRIAGVAQQLLKPGGRLFFEINERFAQATIDMLQQAGYQQVEAHQDLRGKERMVVALWR
ncbi:peptide chain release factor N(5)-glutamine methyltransferase [Rufibacter glacialis]|uniref:Release factor glutamine methyltransferase n=1 Tax=Rufibacter glacialis TaxID=1259555 RepID=A0A5M8QEI8_9BACT|nr:peptide chain release factor N(5)-glutamine methyltransferase [Rufibacter glacialis]KAA6433403.1 peptide chain release factor N(5)-glutamine methyltransferase [Rufibacter glacialis]GGK74556.1 release factor glutamine methyltransferase [Rufibacter glacialis]